METKKTFHGMQNIRPTSQDMVMKYGSSIILALEKVQVNSPKKSYMNGPCSYID
jgi:hypothetical protein